ncbi:MAG: hypothetical protein M3094_03780 [Actinomycetia bacterium]|nr:hypothetical protein [Actinomycetes bacterium]
MTNDYSTLDVCTTHLALVGMYRDKEHRCPCDSGGEGWREREWDGYDIAALLELCSLCVRDVMKSGTRWSWRACDTCRSVNNEIATAINGEVHPGNQVLPLGRHSIMNGIAIGSGALRSGDLTEESVEPLASFFEFSNRLIDWRQEEGRRLTDRGGFAGQSRVPLVDWLAANPVSLGASVDAFCRFVDQDDIPDLRDLDGLRDARRAHVEGGL